MAKRKETAQEIIDRFSEAMIRNLLNAGYTEPMRHVSEAMGYTVLTSTTKWKLPGIRSEVASKRQSNGECASDILKTIRKARGPLKGSVIVERLKSKYGKGTVLKILADLVANGELENRHDRRGYWLPGKQFQPRLFKNGE